MFLLNCDVHSYNTRSKNSLTALLQTNVKKFHFIIKGPKYIIPLALKFRIPLVLRPCQGGSHVARLNFKMSSVGVYKCLSLIFGFAVTVAIWPREVVPCCNFTLRTVATIWAMSLVGIYPGRASVLLCSTLNLSHFFLVQAHFSNFS